MVHRVYFFIQASTDGQSFEMGSLIISILQRGKEVLRGSPAPPRLLASALRRGNSMPLTTTALSSSSWISFQPYVSFTPTLLAIILLSLCSFKLHIFTSADLVPGTGLGPEDAEGQDREVLCC